MKRSYEKIALKAVENGFKAFNFSERLSYEKKVNQFLNYYKKQYKNAYSEDFQGIINIEIVKSLIELENKIRLNKDVISNQKSGNFFIYRIVFKEKQFVRIGKTVDYVARLIKYLSKAFTSGKTHLDVTNLHLDIRALKNRCYFNNQFEYQILLVSPNLEYVKTTERLLTIYENKYENDIGFDLSINNYYNKIVGDLYDYIDGDFQNHHPNWREILPEKIESTIKIHYNWDDILRQFQDIDSITTIMRRAVSFGFTIRGTGCLQDIRAYFMKPILINCILKDYNPIQIASNLIRGGFTFLKQLSNTIRGRKQWFNKMCNYIWGYEMNKIGFSTATIFRVRKLLLFKELLKVARNPKYNTFSKAEGELHKCGIKLKEPNPPKDRGELYGLMKNLPLEEQFSYKREQNKILAPRFAELLRYDNPRLSVGDIAEKFGLNKYNDKNLIINMIIRIFQCYVKHPRSVNVIRDFLGKSTLFT